jgi:hypothetical protein
MYSTKNQSLLLETRIKLEGAVFLLAFCMQFSNVCFLSFAEGPHVSTLVMTLALFPFFAKQLCLSGTVPVAAESYVFLRKTK